MVHSWTYLFRMEIHRFLVVGSWEAYVHITIPVPFSPTEISFSGLWKEHILVRRF